ncbi:unnamed protein product [Cylindrotheca closterium]|uniref:J domain-containing protein n=1 Tax=Cylindrotheca closterium TaxID=2856 RepID=A0AAD2G0S7_9STRA|nr:unnamed protein product [Cylindrotheca closterium]
MGDNRNNPLRPAMLSQSISRRRQRNNTTSPRKVTFLASCWAIFCILSCYSVEVVIAVDSDYDYVKEVLEEEQQHYGDDYNNNDDRTQESKEELLRKQQEQAKAHQEEQDRLRAEKLAQERERSFQKELARLDEEQRKKALKQKKKDTKLVKTILKWSQQSSIPDPKTGAIQVPDFYKILGLRNWNLYLPAKKIEAGPIKFTFPGVTLKKTSQKDIRKAFRLRTKMVHPDKNKDGFAHEAFLAVEHAASVLSDETSRKQYDLQLQAWQKAHWEQQQEVVMRVWRTIRNTMKAISSVLGPFATPIFILTALII